ncbi:GIY-YIG nuclease family protein [Frankia sp. AgW1.1]|uniref:GIY-YIG nuclease family protein n=1 Tax=Frankia sp. AgW1.1 TaxID=1836971 RepID=UPI001931977C|nr:GIY-YIG nuclease family protein [Frankia sp. AgW1.1]MBL7487109.1 hypothetical protein [Frankia sp. AgW1.1]
MHSIWYEDPLAPDPSKFKPSTWCDLPGCTERALPKGEGEDLIPINICFTHLRVAMQVAKSFGPAYSTMFDARVEAVEPDGVQLPPGTSLVYYLKFGERIKIGYTTNLHSRLTGIPHDDLLAVERGGRLLEGTRHRQFAHLRVVGEWFEQASDLDAHIARLGDATPTVLAEHYTSLLPEAADPAVPVLLPDALVTTTVIAMVFDVPLIQVHNQLERRGLMPTVRGRGRRESQWRWGDIERVMSIHHTRTKHSRRPKADPCQLPIWL